MSKQLRILMLAVMALLISVGMQAQITTAAMGGRVIDDMAEPVIGASVRAVHEPSGSVYGAVTNVDGRYSIQGMRTGGPYTVTVSYVGFSTQTFSNLTLQLGEVYNLNVDLSENIAQLGEVVVTATASKFAAEKTGAVTNINQATWRYVARRDPLRKAEDYLDPGLDGYPGVERVQLVSGGPDTMPNNQVSMQYLAMIQNARRRLYITTPYLDPEESIKAALMCAAGSGVDVRILIPDKKDHIFVFWNNMTFANELMEAGVKVYRYHDGFIHEKVVISDGHCCSVGSANLDNRSLNQNFETNVVLYSERLTRQLTDQFLEDLEHSTQYSCEEYNERTTVMKMRMAVSRLLQMFA